MTTDLIREMEAEAADREAHLLDLVLAVDMLGKQIKPLKRARKAASDELKQGMVFDGRDTLADPERGLLAQLQDRAGTPVYDLVRATETVEGCEAIIEAAKAGMLRLDDTMLKRFRDGAGADWADTLNRFKGPGKGTTALVVGEDED